MLCFSTSPALQIRTLLLLLLLLPSCCNCCRCPLLLLAPASVLDNWMHELAQWGAFKAVKLHSDPMVTKHTVKDGVEDGSIEIVITSHDTYRCSALLLAH